MAWRHTHECPKNDPNFHTGEQIQHFVFDIIVPFEKD